MMMNSKKAVTPAKAGGQCFCNHLIFLDAGFCRNNVHDGFSTFYESVNYGCWKTYGLNKHQEPL